MSVAMGTPLPTASELEKLPLRAIVAYAARMARRLCAELRGVVADPILEDALNLVDAVWVPEPVRDVDAPSVMYAAARVAAAYAAAPRDMKSLHKTNLVYSVVHAAEAAAFARIASDPANCAWEKANAAKEAERTGLSIKGLPAEAARAATQAALSDYGTLVREYGENQERYISTPITCFTPPESDRGASANGTAP